MGGYPRLPGQKECKMQDKVSTASPPPGEVGGATLNRDLTELRWTDHEAAKIVIFEAKATMHHATSAHAGTERWHLKNVYN